MSDTPAHSAIIRAAIERIVGACVRTGIPGQIEAYDAEQQRADVQPLILDGKLIAGDRVVERLPVITDVPIIFGGTSRDRPTYALERGDTVWVMMSSHSLDLWLQQGGEVDPKDDRRHNISDAVAIPGLFDFAHVPSDASTDGYILHAKSKLRLGGPSASSAVVVQDALDLFVQALTNASNSAALVPAPMAPGKAALVALLAALTTGLAPPAPPIPALAAGWKAGTSKTKAE